MAFASSITASWYLPAFMYATALVLASLIEVEERVRIAIAIMMVVVKED
jgi:hypothetical protein